MASPEQALKDVERRRAAGAEAAAGAALLERLLAVLVVQLPLLGVGQHLKRGSNLLELFARAENERGRRVNTTDEGGEGAGAGAARVPSGEEGLCGSAEGAAKEGAPPSRGAAPRAARGTPARRHARNAPEAGGREARRQLGVARRCPESVRQPASLLQRAFSGSPPLSGWFFTAALRYAFFTSSAEAFLSMPSTA